MRIRNILSLLILCLVFALSACAAKVAEPPKAADPPTSYCVWVLWTANQTLLAKAQDMLAQDKSFSEVARTISEQGGDEVRTSLDCMPVSRMEPMLLEGIKDLKLGQVSMPLSIDNGQALVMRTTDKFRREGFRLYEQGMYAKAEEALLKDLELHPHSPEVWHLLAMCRSSLGKLNASLEAMDRALELQPESASVLQDKATALVSMGRENEALELYHEALKKDPENALVMSNLAWTLARLGKQLIEAEKLARKSLELNPQNARYWNTLGTVYTAQRRHAPALVCYYRTAAIDPDFAKVDQRILSSVKLLSPYEISKLADIPKEMLKVAVTDDPDAEGSGAASGTSLKSKAAKENNTPNRLAYSLQVGAYRQPGVAKEQVRLWNSRGQSAYLETYVSKKSGVWLRMMVGDYTSRAQARKLAKKFLRVGFIKEYVIQVRKLSYVKKKIAEVNRNK